MTKSPVSVYHVAIVKATKCKKKQKLFCVLFASCLIWCRPGVYRSSLANVKTCLGLIVTVHRITGCERVMSSCLCFTEHENLS